jgi:hypothetical protein
MAYDTRLATRIPRELDERLRALAFLSRRPLQHVLSDLLARALPTSAELAEQLSKIGSADDEH